MHAQASWEPATSFDRVYDLCCYMSSLIPADRFVFWRREDGSTAMSAPDEIPTTATIAAADPAEELLAEIRSAVAAVCRPFDDDYWSRCDEEHRFPVEFYDAMASGGWVGIA